MERVLVIAPDRPSGEAFDAALRGKGIETEIVYADIEPRVIGDQMNPDPKVQADLAGAIKTGYERGYRKMVIACNTLQLWLIEAMEQLPKEICDQVKVVTTFEAVARSFPDRDHRPVWLGTTVTARLIKDFPTLVSVGREDVQKLVQEIVWRTKAVTGADMSTAGDIEEIDSPVRLQQIVTQVAGELKGMRIKTAVMGCTELPMAFSRYANTEDKAGLTLVDPAEAVAMMI